MADKFDKITDTENITCDVDVWQSNKRHTESEFKTMFKSPTLKLIDRVNKTIDDINERIMSTERTDNLRVNGSLQSRVAKNEDDIDKLQIYEPHVQELADAAHESAQSASDSESQTKLAKKAMEEHNAATIAETTAIKEATVKETSALKAEAETARDYAQKFAVNSPAFVYNGNTYYSAKYWADLSRSYFEHRNKAFVFDTTAQVLAWYNGSYTRTDGLTKENLVVGDLVLIKELNVPDVWYSGEAETDTSFWWHGYPFALWEGDKVALLEYTERAETAADNAESALALTQKAADEVGILKNSVEIAHVATEKARDDALSAADNSELSAKEAMSSQAAAKMSESNAEYSENKAKKSEENAKASELSASKLAKESEVSADAAATEATASAASAAQSAAKAQEAAQSETNAAASATTAGQHKTAAEAAKTAAESAQGAAKKSATDAAKSADIAKSSEINAASSANDSNSSSVHSGTQAEAALAAAIRAEAAAQRTEAVANGLQKRIVFDTVQAVLDWYNNNGTITVNGQSYTPADLHVGDDIYVIETGVSDVWYVGEGKNETNESVWWYGLPFTYLETNSEELIGYSEEAKAAQSAAKTSETLAGQYAAQAQVSASESEASRQSSEAAKVTAEAAKEAARTSETNAAGSATQAKTDADYVRDIRDSLVLSDGTYPNLGAGKDGAGNGIADTYARKDELPTTADDLNRIAVNGYVMSDSKVIDATGLDENKWYPVTIDLRYIHGSDNDSNIRIEVYAFLYDGDVPSWSIHAAGFSCCKIWETSASGWGANEVSRRILVSCCAFAPSNPIRKIDQGYKNSNEYFYIRGGGKYLFRSSCELEPILNPEGYTWPYADPQHSYTLPVLDSEPADSPITIVDTENKQTISGHKSFVNNVEIYNGDTNTFLELGKSGATGIEFHIDDNNIDLDATIQCLDGTNPSKTPGGGKLKYIASGGHEFGGPVVAKGYNDFISAGNEFNFVPSGYNSVVHFNYRTASGNQDGYISNYIFDNSGGGYAGIEAGTMSVMSTAADKTNPYTRLSLYFERAMDDGNGDKSAWFGGIMQHRTTGYGVTTAVGQYRDDDDHDAGLYIGMGWDGGIDTYFKFNRNGGLKVPHNIEASEGHFSGLLKANNTIFSYAYATSNNIPAFALDKPGACFAGIGSHETPDTIWFGACVNDNSKPGAWVDDYYQNWNFNGYLQEQGQRVYSPNNLPTQLIAKDGSNPVFVLPYVSYQIIEPTNDTFAYFRELLKWICRNYPGVTYGTWIGVANPNSAGQVKIDIYDTNDVNNDGIPKYSTGVYRSLSNTTRAFHTNNYVYDFRDYDEYYYSNNNPPPLKNNYIHHITLKVNDTTSGRITFILVDDNAISETNPTSIAQSLLKQGFTSEDTLCSASGGCELSGGNPINAQGLYTNVDGTSAFVHVSNITGRTQSLPLTTFTSIRDVITIINNGS